MFNNRIDPHHVISCALLYLLAGTTLGLVAQDNKNVKKTFNDKPAAAIKQLENGNVNKLKKFVPELVQVYLGDRWSLGVRAGKLLQQTGRKKPKKVVPVLVKKLNSARSNGNRSGRLRLIRLLGKIGSNAGTAVDALIAELNSGNEALERAALDALKEVGPAASSAVPHMSAFLTHSSAVLRRNAFAAIMSCGSGTKRIKAFGPALLSKDAYVKRSALDHMESSDATLATVVDPLISLAKNDAQERVLRRRALQLLKRGGTPAAKHVDQIVRIGRDAPSDLRTTAQNIINHVKTSNRPPEPKPVKRRCGEGRSIDLTFSATDPDDLQVGLRAVIVDPPKHGSVRRTGKRQFTFTSRPGHTGKISFRWRMKDPKDQSEPSTATIQITPDVSPPIVRSARVVNRNRKHVRLHVHEPITPESAKKTEHYEVKGGTVKKAELLQEGRVVRLTTNPEKKGFGKKITVSKLVDRSQAGNQIQRPVTLSISREIAPKKNLLLISRASGTFRDQSPHGRKANTSDGASLDPRRGKGGAFSFSGRKGNKKNAVNYGQIEALQSAKTFTVGFWFRRRTDVEADSNHGTSNIMFSQGSNGANDNIEIGTDGSNVEVMLDTESGGVSGPWNGHIENNTWYHLALTFDSSRNREAWLYINGKNVKKWSADGALSNATSPVTLGNTFHIEAPFSGWMDEVFLYDRVLEQEEIASLKGDRPFGRGKLPYSTEKLVFLAPGDGTARDRSGYRRHGSIQAGAKVSDKLGKAGAFSFKGNKKQENSVRFPFRGVLDGAKQFTAGFWFRRQDQVKVSSGPEVWNVLLSYGDKETEGLKIGTTGGRVDVYTRTENGEKTALWNGDIINGRWHYLALTYDQTRKREARLFVDGNVVKQWSVPDGSLRSGSKSARLSIGNSLVHATPFAGWIDEVMLYRRSLDKRELRNAMGDRPHSRDKLLLLARGDGNANDRSGAGRDGTPTEGVDFTSDIGIGKAFRFSGKEGEKNNAVNFGTIDPLQEADSFSIAFWFLREADRDGTTNHGTGNVLFSQGSDDENDNLEIGTSGSNIDLFMQTPTYNGKKSYDAGIKNGKWYHLALTYDADRKNGAWLYLNGKVVKKWTVWNKPLTSASAPVTIGNTFHIETPFKGLMDEVYLYNRALHPQEIRTIMERQ